MNVGAKSLPQRLEIVFRKVAALLPQDVGQRLLAAMTPEALATVGAVVALWAVSHFVGVGQMADVIMLAAGLVTLGAEAIEASKRLIDFGIKTHGARSEADLDAAARDLSAAMAIIGVDAVLAMLFRGRPKGTFKTIYKPEYRILSWAEFRGVMPRTGPTRMYPAEIVYTRTRPVGRGGTRPDNLATIGRQFSPEHFPLTAAVRNLKKAVYHERFHQRWTQAYSLLGRPALYAKMGAYKRSFILRYISEAAAETWALARVGGVRAGEVAGYRFPINEIYDITLVQLGAEAKGILLGPVIVGGIYFQAWYGLSR